MNVQAIYCCCQRQSFEVQLTEGPIYMDMIYHMYVEKSMHSIAMYRIHCIWYDHMVIKITTLLILLFLFTGNEYADCQL